MILLTKKFTFQETITVDLPDGSIPIEFKEGKGLLTLWYWEEIGAPPKPHTFCFYKKGSETADVPNNLKQYMGSLWLSRLWWQVYELE